MKFIYHKNVSLPKLAWCAIMIRNSDVIHIYHGPWLETRNNFFVEGAWDGAFDEGKFENAYLMGSGAKIINNEVMFCTACHSHERLQYVLLNDKLFLSPSLAFLLTAAELKLDINYISYHSKLKLMLAGINQHVNTIPCYGSQNITVCHFRNLYIDNQLNIKLSLKKINSPDFKNYNDYKKFITSRFLLLSKNAVDNSRNIKYLPLATISTGYDSTACSVIAQEAGCKEAVTFRDARGEEKAQGTDSGKAIADILGYSIKEFDRREYIKKHNFPEAEFVANGDMGQDFELCTFEEKWKLRLVVVGNGGWYAWNKSLLKEHLEIPLLRNDFEGDSWIEYKFRVGFITCNLPIIGAINRKTLYTITHSSEMKPFILNTKYDRPIARRIVEEAGVPRQLFGQQKKAISILLNNNSNLKKWMNSESYKSFLNFYKKNKNKRNLLKQIFFLILFRLYRINYWSNIVINKLFKILMIKKSSPHIIPIIFSESPGKPSYLVHWGIEQLQRRYKNFCV